jgi:hypothetical protein
VRESSSSLSIGVSRPSAFFCFRVSSLFWARSLSRFISLRRAFDSSASRASRAALWLSVWRIMLRKKFVLGFGAPDFSLGFGEFLLGDGEVQMYFSYLRSQSELRHTFWN